MGSASLAFLGDGLSQQTSWSSGSYSISAFLWGYDPWDNIFSVSHIDTLLIKTGVIIFHLTLILNESFAFPEIYSHNLYLQIVLFVSSLHHPQLSFFFTSMYYLQFQG